VLVQSQRDPKNDPLIVWFNGGPGCSSMLGFLQEHGPYKMDDNDTQFTKNDWSWNKEANMLYIESPAGVGYSYCDSSKYCASGDESSSLDNLEAMLSFFKKFPEYQKNDLYLSGESYAGIYVPYLAWRMHEFNLWLNSSTIAKSLHEARFLQATTDNLYHSRFSLE
jgi:carboxypeptidase C (cathepsin A)